MRYFLSSIINIEGIENCHLVIEKGCSMHTRDNETKEVLLSMEGV